MTNADLSDSSDPHEPGCRQISSSLIIQKAMTLPHQLSNIILLSILS